MGIGTKSKTKFRTKSKTLPRFGVLSPRSKPEQANIQLELNNDSCCHFREAKLYRLCVAHWFNLLLLFVSLKQLVVAVSHFFTQSFALSLNSARSFPLHWLGSRGQRRRCCIVCSSSPHLQESRHPIGSTLRRLCNNTGAAPGPAACLRPRQDQGEVEPSLELAVL